MRGGPLVPVGCSGGFYKYKIYFIKVSVVFQIARARTGPSRVTALLCSAAAAAAAFFREVLKRGLASGVELPRSNDGGSRVLLMRVFKCNFSFYKLIADDGGSVVARVDGY